MRSISLVEHVEFDYKGSVFQNAVCLIDIDNDDSNELAVCNTDGYLSIFKGIESSKPWAVHKGLGPVFVLCGGRLEKDGLNVLCCINTAGYTYIFDVVNNAQNDSVSITANISSPRNAELRLLHSQKLAPNAKVALMKDLMNDGNAELIVGYTGRTVNIYKWITKVNLSKSQDDIPNLKVIPNDNDTEPLKEGSFVLLQRFYLLGQVGSLAVCRTIEGLNKLVVSQPNGAYNILGIYGKDKKGYHPDARPNSSSSEITTDCIESHHSIYTIHSKFSRTTTFTDTQIIGGIKRANEESGLLAICTQDSNFAIVNNVSSGNVNILKNMSDERWFCMAAVDLTGTNGDDEIVLCSLSGMTYLIDKQMDLVSYNFNENVSAFCAGHFGSYGPCLCYVTLTGKIFVYYEVWLDAMKVKCIHGALIEKLKDRQDLQYILDMFKRPNGEIDHRKIQYLVKNIWSQKY